MDEQNETVCLEDAVAQQRLDTHKREIADLNRLHKFHRVSFVDKLYNARYTLADQQLKLKVMQSAKAKKHDSIETKMFKVLKEIGVGGSLNGKDIIKVMNNATYVFDKFTAIFTEGKRTDCVLTDTEINALCLHFREVFVLWDGAFSLARTVNPTEEDMLTYRSYVDAAVKGILDLQCTITPKVHLMLKHVETQMRNIPGGLEDKAEDWVERLHQTGMRLRQRF